MSYLDRVVSGEGQNRLNSNLISTGRGMVRCILEMFIAQLHKSPEIKKIRHVVKSKCFEKDDYINNLLCSYRMCKLVLEFDCWEVLGGLLLGSITGNEKIFFSNHNIVIIFVVTILNYIIIVQIQDYITLVWALKICQLEFKENSFPSHEPNYQSLIHLYFPSPLTVAVFTETLRKYPSLPFLERKSSSDYELPAPDGNGTITLPAGTAVFISALALHYDPTYFPEPEKFDPDRFTEQNKRSRPNYAYIPFGEGPRMCLGKDRQTGFGRMCLGKDGQTGLIECVSGISLRQSTVFFVATTPFCLAESHTIFSLKNRNKIR
jgi:hypothetical protein